MALAGVTSVEGANRLQAETCIARHNARFAAPAEQEGSGFVPDRAGLWREILRIQKDRAVGNDNTVKWRNQTTFEEGAMATILSGPDALLAITAVGQFAGLLIWGATLGNRVKQIERELEPLRGLAVAVARMEARLDGLMDQLRDLNATLRWGRPSSRDDCSPDA